jgi:RNA polymerase sigma factor (sigma-70 family)
LSVTCSPTQRGTLDIVTDLAAEFETHRPQLFGLAYRLLGSASEAEDAVQDAYLRLHKADHAAIRSMRAWLTKVVTNVCLNQLTSARARRESYAGPWLPEAVFTADGALGPLETAEQRDSVSIALLTLMERLTPAERAAFVLREAFSYSHGDIADILDTSEANWANGTNESGAHPKVSAALRRASDHLMILVTRPAPTVRPPSRIAKRRPSSMATGWISFTEMSVLSPGMTISVPSGSVTTPVTSVVRK